MQATRNSAPRAQPRPAAASDAGSVSAQKVGTDELSLSLSLTEMVHQIGVFTHNMTVFVCKDR